MESVLFDIHMSYQVQIMYCLINSWVKEIFKILMGQEH